MSNTIQTGKFAQPLPISCKDEIGNLTDCFNQLGLTLQHRRQQLKQAFVQVETQKAYIQGVINSMRQSVLVIAPAIN